MTFPARLNEICAEYWTFLRHEQPITAFLGGQPMPEDALMREAPGDYARRSQAVRPMLAALEAVPVSELRGQDRASHALLRRELRHMIIEKEVKAHMRPTLFPLGPEAKLTYWANATTLNSPEEAQLYADRLRLIPSALDSVKDSLEAGITERICYPAHVTRLAAAMVRALATTTTEETPFYTPFTRAPGRFEQAAGDARRAIADAVRPALADYADFIAGPLSEVARESIACTDAPLGECFYASLIERYTTLDESPAVIHAIGLEEVSRIRAEMETVARSAGFDVNLAAFRRHIMSNTALVARSADELREQIEILSKRIDARIPEFFGRTPRSTYGVRSIPEAIAAKQPPAYAQPNPADNSAAGVHWVTSIPAKLPSYLHPAIALHEAWPGHLMHIALMQEMADLPEFRRFGSLNYSAFLEGWGLYCERLGEDMGLYDTHEKRYGRLDMEMWRASRLVADTGIHAKGWRRDEAIGFMQENLALPMQTIEAEVDRYIAWPAQALGYQLGNLRFNAIRRRAEAQLGTKFRLRDFHDALMATGPVTLPVLDDLLNDWINSQAA